MSILCNTDMPTGKTLMLTPILHCPSLFKRVRAQTINFGTDEKVRIKVHSYSLPVYIPEAGCTSSFNISSEKIRMDFEDLTLDPEQFSLSNRIITSDVYNFDDSVNRIVSRGQYLSNVIDEKYYNIFASNILTDMLMSPSVMIKDEVCNPIRWFRTETSGQFYFSSTANYNSVILYMKKEDLLAAQKFKIWMGEVMDLFCVKCLFIKFNVLGEVISVPLSVFFRDDPFEMADDMSTKGEYFISFMFSLNEYKSSFREGRPYGRSINIIDYIMPMVYSHYDIALRLHPLFSDVHSSSNTVMESSVPEEVIRRIIYRLIKFGGSQSQDAIDAFNSVFEKRNPLIRFDLSEKGKCKLKMLNPAVVYNLIHMCLNEKNKLLCRCGRDILDKPGNIIDEIESPNELAYLMVPDLSGIWKANPSRVKNMERYTAVFRKFN